MCQEMPTRLYASWEYDSETDLFEARNNTTRNFANMVMPFYQELRPECKIDRIYTTGKPKKIDCFHVEDYYDYDHCKTVFEAMDCC